MSKNNSVITAYVLEDKNIIINIPIDLLFYAENNREYDPLIVENKEKMAEWVTKNILEWGGNQNTGCTEFQVFLDRMFIEALEDGQDWLKQG